MEHVKEGHFMERSHSIEHQQQKRIVANAISTSKGTIVARHKKP